MIVLIGVAGLTGPLPVATAQDHTPEDLWNAYPLNPGEKDKEAADPAPTPTAGSTPAPAPSVTPSPPAAGDSGGSGLLVPLLIGCAVAVLGVGQVLRRRRRPGEPEPEPAPAPVARSVPEPQPATPPPRAAPAPPAPLADPPPHRRPAPPAAPREEPRTPARRFARQEWPAEAATTWTCVIDWKPGYLKSRFRAMAAPPGQTRRTLFGHSRSRWTFMDEPGPPTPDMVEIVTAVVTALTEAGWVSIGPSGPWYAHRFLWGGDGQPRPLAPQSGKEANA